MTDDARRERMIELLRSQHKFPGPFSLSVVTHQRDAVKIALRAAIEAELPAPLSDDAWQERPSKGGKYVSHRLVIECRDAEHVLAIYARIQAVEGVIQVM